MKSLLFNYDYLPTSFWKHLQTALSIYNTRLFVPTLNVLLWKFSGFSETSLKRDVLPSLRKNIIPVKFVYRKCSLMLGIATQIMSL